MPDRNAASTSVRAKESKLVEQFNRYGPSPDEFLLPASARGMAVIAIDAVIHIPVDLPMLEVARVVTSVATCALKN